jgi:hypothetical protein
MPEMDCKWLVLRCHTHDPGRQPEPVSAPAHDQFWRLLSQSPVPLTRQEILCRWPADHPDQGANAKK